MRRFTLTVVYAFLTLILLTPTTHADQVETPLPSPYGQGTYVPTSRGHIYYEADGEGTPVILINGGPGASRTVFWGALDFLKTEGYMIVYFDETGVGRATREINEEFSPHITVEDIETLRSHLGAEKIILAGHSYGGVPALQYAVKNPHNVEKLLMLSASIDATSQQMNVDAAAYLRKTFFPIEWEEMERMRADGILTSDKEYLRKFTERKIGDASDWHDPQKRASLRKYRSHDPRDRSNFDVYLDIAGEDAEVEITGTLSTVSMSALQLEGFSVPTLILNGRMDWKTTPEMAYRFYKMLPKGIGQLAFLERTGHWTWAEEPELFEELITEFIAQK